MNKKSDTIEQLMHRYTFAELGSEQRILVLSEMSEQEYTQLQLILQRANTLSKQDVPPLPAEIKSNLKQQLRLGSLPIVENYRRWLAPILGLLAGIFITTGWFLVTTPNESDIIQNNEPAVTDTILVYVPTIDTVYLATEAEPRVIAKEVVKYIVQELPTLAPQPMAILQQPTIATQSQDVIYGSYKTIEFVDVIPISMGKPIGEESELMNLLVEMPSDGLE